MADNLIILLHPVREPLDQTAVGALELLARMRLPIRLSDQMNSIKRVGPVKGPHRRSGTQSPLIARAMLVTPSRPWPCLRRSSAIACSTAHRRRRASAG